MPVIQFSLSCSRVILIAVLLIDIEQQVTQLSSLSQLGLFQRRHIFCQEDQLVNSRWLQTGALHRFTISPALEEILSGGTDVARIPKQFTVSVTQLRISRGTIRPCFLRVFTMHQQPTATSVPDLCTTQLASGSIIAADVINMSFVLLNLEFNFLNNDVTSLLESLL